MPIITVKFATPRHTGDFEAAIASEVAELSSSLLKKNPSLTAVVVERVPANAWYVAGQSLETLGKSSFWLSIKVVQGTNTKDEKALFVAAVFKRMADCLGDLHDESYVYVEEVYADSYGFGGRTQEERYILARHELIAAQGLA
ncbi:4-oxalocrotonate tautomerase [Sphingomonas sp. So64.6b]|uniref:tautomerase family protein n=1 Tax=Sphingomonas sp. So64.6b TaxID=2997354 RepID=UPI00160112DB|nr:4-oxalocrotonate tautomerase family protein [Sphingomonas sp. So64.6b]QNA84692.1 4-oxalocrotonate tautomerase [Sphingomonas sp. So64.6b]